MSNVRFPSLISRLTHQLSFLAEYKITGQTGNKNISCTMHDSGEQSRGMTVYVHTINSYVEASITQVGIQNVLKFVSNQLLHHFSPKSQEGLSSSVKCIAYSSPHSLCSKSEEFPGLHRSFLVLGFSSCHINS